MLADAWLKEAGARALGVGLSDEEEYTLADAAVDGEKSDAEQERAATLLLAEDALVRGAELAAAGRLATGALRKLLELAATCKIAVAGASPLNDRAARPLRALLDHGGEEAPAKAVAALLLEHVGVEYFF